MYNPFTELLNKIEHKVRCGEPPPDKLLIVVATQSKLLKVLYRAMLEFNMKENSFNVKVSHEEFCYKSTKSVLDYFQFITVLNQLGRFLDDKKYNITIPKYYRVRFFRNKVSEHWEDYSIYGTNLQYQLPGEAAIPAIKISSKPEEMREIKFKIDAILKVRGFVLDIENPEMGQIGAGLNYEEKIYSTLEKIDPTLNSKNKRQYLIPDELVKLLFQFGFPPPIDKVTEYSSELVNFLEKELRLKTGLCRPDCADRTESKQPKKGAVSRGGPRRND